MIRRLPKKPKREPWIPPRKKVDQSRMDSCKEAKARAEALIQMGCIVTGRKQGVVIHHLREGVGMGMRAPWWRTIPLLARLHDANFPYSVHGRDRERFFQDHGDEEALLARVNARLPSHLNGETP